MNKAKLLTSLVLVGSVLAAIYLYLPRAARKEISIDVSAKQEVSPRAANKGSNRQTASKALAKDGEASSKDTMPIFGAHWTAWEHSKLEEWLEHESACAFMDSDFISKGQLNDLLPHLLAHSTATSANAIPSEILEDLVEAFSTDTEAVALTALRRHSHPVSRFYEALIIAGLLYDRGIPTGAAGNLSQAAAILESLSNEDASNGAYFIYLAKVKQSQGFSAAATIPLLNAGFSAPRFSTYVMEFMQSIQERALQKPALWPIAEEMRRRIPMPNYLELRNAILDALRNSDSTFAEKAYFFAIKLKQKHEANSKGSDVIYWLPIEHAIAKKVAIEAWKKLHPTELPPKEIQGDYRRFMKNSFLAHAVPGILKEIGSEEDCERMYPKLFSLIRSEQELFHRGWAPAASL